MVVFLDRPIWRCFEANSLSELRWFAINIVQISCVFTEFLELEVQDYLDSEYLDIS